mgnify:CR=1 FL=1
MSVDARATVNLIRMQSKVSFTTVKAATVSTARMESLATRLDDSINDWFYDSAVLSEVLVKVIAKPVVENIAITELYSAGYSKIPPTDTAQLADTFAKVVTWNRNITDAFTLDDAAQVDKDYYGNKGNVTQMLDFLNIQLSNNFADSCTVGDVLAIVMAYNKSNSISVGDVPILRNRSGTLMNGTFFNNITLN